MLGKIDQARLKALCELVAACAFVSGCGGGGTQGAITASTASAGTATTAGTPVASPAPAPTPAPAVASNGIPSYAAASAMPPGWMAGTYSVGKVITADFGVPANGATSFEYTCYRNGTAIPGATGTTTSEFQTYTIVSADLGTVLSCQVTPTNTFGVGSAQTIAGLYVNS